MVQEKKMVPIPCEADGPELSVIPMSRQRPSSPLHHKHFGNNFLPAPEETGLK